MKHLLLSLITGSFLLVWQPALAQQPLPPEQEALKEKLVQMVLFFKPAEWEQTKTELREVKFPVYSLSHEAIQEAWFRLEHVYDQDQDSARNAEMNYSTKLLADYVAQNGKLRLKEDYLRIVSILENHDPPIKYGRKLAYRLDENRQVTSISFSHKHKKRYLPPEKAAYLVNLLQQKNYQAYENTEVVVKPYKARRRSMLSRWYRKMRRKLSGKKYPQMRIGR